MPGYKYIAYGLDGHEARGVLESDSPRLARARLREQGLFPLEVALIEAANEARIARSRWFGAGAALPSAELASLTRQLATLIGAGLTIEQTFNALIDQAEGESERQLLASVRGSVLEGQSLAQALTAYPTTFSDLYRTLVNAGETSGKLPEVLLRLADYVEEQQAIKQKLMVAMIYPAIVMVICLSVVIGLMIYVVPQVVGVFESTKQTLPLMTRALLGLSHFVQVTGVFWLIVGGLAVFVARWLLRRETNRRRWHLFLLRMPILGRMLRTRDATQLASTLSILASSGIPVLHALNAASGVVGLLPIREALQRATTQVREGIPLSAALKAQQPGANKLFPPVMIHLIASGEASGRLSTTLESAARQQQRELETRSAALAALIEPVMIVIMGVIVLSIVLAVLLPIFELNQLVVR